jgi:Cytochrome P450
MVAITELGPADVASTDELLRAQREDRVVRSKRGLEVLRYRDALEALRHPQLWRAKLFLWRHDQIGLGPGFARSFMERMLNTQEGEQRKHLRTPMARILAPRSIRTLTEGVQTIVDGILDEIENPDDVDFLEEVCWRLPSMVYCLMVSAPFELAPTVQRLSDSMVGPMLTLDASRLQELQDARKEAYEIAVTHIEERRNDLGDDFTSALIREEMDGNLTTQELHDLGTILLEASVDNTAHAAAILVARLLERPADWERVREDRALIAGAAEETMRLWPRFRTHIRYAAEDTEFAGAPLAKDDMVYISVQAAQRDPEVFPDPETFDITRPLVPSTLMFGQGQYSCIGMHLARLEMHMLLNTLLDRFPNMRLLEYGDKEGPFIRSVTSCRVSLTGN